MQIKEIKYNGFTETPSDYECPDGDLATVSGLVPEEEGLKAVQKPKVKFELPNNSAPNYWAVSYIHKNPGYRHIIVRFHSEVTADNVTTITDKFYWMTEPESFMKYSGEIFEHHQYNTHDLAEFTNKQIYQINSIGNVIVILTEDGMYYFLWKGDHYINLGNKMPEPKLSFGLRGEAEMNQTNFSFSIDAGVAGTEEQIWKSQHSQQTWPPVLSVGEEYVAITNDYKKGLTDGVMARVNEFIASRSVKAGKFIFPFLVRYAYRLYDESLVMHSCPVLMITDTYCSPHANVRLSSNGRDFEGILGAMLYDIDYQAIIPNEYSSMEEYLGDWGEIIKSIDIFISEPIYTYNQSGNILGWDDKLLEDRGYGMFRIPDSSKVYHGTDVLDNSVYSRYYTTRLIYSFYTTDDEEFTLPMYSADEMKQKIKDVHNFYLFKSIAISDVKTEARTKIALPESFLSNMTGYELMSDDIYTHDLLIPRSSFTYNNRLTIANISRRIENPFIPGTVECYTDYSMADYTHRETVATAFYSVYIYINENNKEMVLNELGSDLGSHNPFIYLFFPNPNAYKAVIEKISSASPDPEYYELPLTKHDFLNGAVYFEGWNPTPASGTEPVLTSDNQVDFPNKIFTSEVDNPFVFPPAGRKTIGIGDILGIRPAVKAMSPSQFGQYKFYVFTTDGLWTMEVSKEGYLQEPTLITPDLVNGQGESITQIDGSVLFATNRGIMMTAGSDTVCMSEILNSKQPFIPFGNTAANDILPKLRNIVPEAILNSAEPIPFLEYIGNCRMAYDYTHQHVIVFNPSQPYAYVYSLKTKLWGMIPSTMRQTVFDYPAATMMIEAGSSGTTAWQMVDYAYEPTVEDQSATPSRDPGVYQGLIITRPLKLDMPDVLKTVPTVIQRGMFERGHVYGALYASRDLIHWTLVWSSVDHYLRGMHGTPYKYFRMALICNLTAKESLYGCSVGVVPRDTNNLR